MIRDIVDGVLIEIDEPPRAFVITLSGENAEYRFRLDGQTAIELLKAVDREIRPWYVEGQAVLAAMHGEDSGYALDDPKHPTYHERMSALADER